MNTQINIKKMFTFKKTIYDYIKKFLHHTIINYFFLSTKYKNDKHSVKCIIKLITINSRTWKYK